MKYELWDTESANVIGEFDLETDALAAVLEAMDLNGEQSVAAFTLLAASDDGAVKGIAGGPELIGLARRQEATPAWSPTQSTHHAPVIVNVVHGISPLTRTTDTSRG